MTVRCVAMMTHNDITVTNALEVFESNKHAKTEYWGFKDDGISLEDAAVLIDAMKRAGKRVLLEPLTLNEDEAVAWAHLAAEKEVDGVLGFYFDTVRDILKKARVKYFPPFGQRTMDQRLLGTPQELAAAAIETLRKGPEGVRLSAFRYIDGDPIAMAKVVIAAIRSEGKEFMLTGSVNDFARIDFVKEMQPWGFTIGGALFEEGKFCGGTVAERLNRIEDYLRG